MRASSWKFYIQIKQFTETPFHREESTYTVPQVTALMMEFGTKYRQ